MSDKDEDTKIVEAYLEVCRNMKPIGRWPGERACVAIERSIATRDAEIAELRRDAERYRWLRDNCYAHKHAERTHPHAIINVCTGYTEDGKHIGWMYPGPTAHVGIPSLDTAIDAAIAEGRE